MVFYISFLSGCKFFLKHIYLCVSLTNLSFHSQSVKSMSILYIKVSPVTIRVPGSQEIFAEWMDGFIVYTFVKNKHGEKYSSNGLNHEKRFIDPHNWKFGCRFRNGCKNDCIQEFKLWASKSAFSHLSVLLLSAIFMLGLICYVMVNRLLLAAGWYPYNLIISV